VKILIKYSENSHQEASDGIFGCQLFLGLKFSIFRFRIMGYSLTVFYKIGKFLTL